MNKEPLKEYLKGFRESWTICMQCGSCYYHGPIVPHNWRELPPFEWSPPLQKCPSYEYFKFRAYSPVGRGNLALLIFDNPNFPITDELIKIIYTCTSCGTCSEICKAHDPLSAIWALKEELIRRGVKIPDFLHKIINNIYSYGNFFGAEKAPLVNRDISKKGKEMLFAGCLMRFTQPSLIETIIDIFREVGLRLAWLGNEEKCCGFLPGWHGDIERMEKQAQLNVKMLKEAGAQRIIVSCAHCYKTLKDYYPRLVDDFPFEVVHIAEVYAQLIDDGKLKFRSKVQEKVTYHDPCFLGRHSGIYDVPRRILESIPGVEFVEMERHGKWSWCCGSGAKVISLCYPEFSMALSRDRLLEAKKYADKIVTACATCVSQMNKAARQGIKMDIYDISDIVARGLGIK